MNGPPPAAGPNLGAAAAAEPNLGAAAACPNRGVGPNLGAAAPNLGATPNLGAAAASPNLGAAAPNLGANPNLGAASASPNLGANPNLGATPNLGAAAASPNLGANPNLGAAAANPGAAAANPGVDPSPDAGPDSGARAAERARIALRAGRIAAVTAGCLALGKLVAGQLGHSMAVTASAVDSLTDLFASSANALAIRLAHAAPDRSHPFGHAKIETLATAGQGLLIGGSGVYLLIEGVRRLLSPEPLRLAAVTLGTMAVAALVTAVLVAYLGRVAARTGSSAIQADAVHYRTDIAANLAVLLGVALTYATGIARVDGVLSIAVAVYILTSAGALLRLGVRDLIDTSAPEPRVAAIEATLEAMRARGELIGYHALRTRLAGRTLFVDVHIELPGDLRLARAHAMGDRARDAILAVEPDAEVLVHIDVERDEPA